MRFGFPSCLITREVLQNEQMGYHTPKPHSPVTYTLYIEVCHLPKSSRTKELSERPQIYNQTSLFPSHSQPSYLHSWHTKVTFHRIISYTSVIVCYSQGLGFDTVTRWVSSTTTAMYYRYIFTLY